MNYYLILIVVGIVAMIALSLAKFFKLQIAIKEPESHDDYGGSIEFEESYPQSDCGSSRFMRQYRFTGNRNETRINK